MTVKKECHSEPCPRRRTSEESHFVIRTRFLATLGMTIESRDNKYKKTVAIVKTNIKKRKTVAIVKTNIKLFKQT